MKQKKTKIIWRGFIIRIIILIILGVFSMALYLGYKIYRMQKNIVQITPSQAASSPDISLLDAAKSLMTFEKIPLRGQEKDRINVLLLGMGGEGHKGEYLTDTIILASINPQTYQSALLSVPRDLYIEIPHRKLYTKINAVYAYEHYAGKSDGEAMDTLRELIKEVTNQEVDYYVAMDFNGFEKVINEIEGVEVEVPEDILDTRYPGPNFSYQTFEIKKGFHHLDGETALKYSRVRHTAGGDFGRARRQQQILAATKKKALSLGTIFHPQRITGLMDTLGQHIKTDISLAEIPSFIELTRNVNIHQTSNVVLDAWSADSLLASSHKLLGGTMAYVLSPRAKSYSQIHDLAENIFDLELIKRKDKAIEEEDASLAVMLDRTTNVNKIKNIFRKLGYTSIDISYKENETCPDKTLIYNNAAEAKLFTLDDLAHKFEAQIIDKQETEQEKDIVICLADDTIDYFTNQNEDQAQENNELKNESVMNNQGEIRINEKR